MKSIKINGYSSPCNSSPYIKHKLYDIRFPNGYVFETKSLTEIKAFLNKTNKLLNQVLTDANFYYSILFTEYRNIWFYMDANFQNHAALKNLISSVDVKLDKSVELCQNMNGNYNAFNYLENGIDDLIKGFELIAKIHYKKSNMPDHHRAKAHIQNLKSLNNKIEKFPISILPTSK